MNQPASSKYVPALPDDNNINEFIPTVPDSKDNFYQGVAECMMNDSDNLKDVKLRAKDLAIQKVKQKIADYVYGFWKDRYLTLPDYEVLSIANEISNITDVKYNVLDSDDDKILIRATITAQIDDRDIMNYIIQFFKEREELKSQNEVLRKENEDLRRQIAELDTQIITKDKITLANQKSDEARRFLYKHNYESAIKLYNESIELNPNDYLAYNGLGRAYSDLNQYERAVQYYGKSIELNPNDEASYCWRGFCYQKLELYEQAIQDYTKAIELYPNNEVYYKSRGKCYQQLGDRTKAQADFSKAKKIRGYA